MPYISETAGMITQKEISSAEFLLVAEDGSVNNFFGLIRASDLWLPNDSKKCQ